MRPTVLIRSWSVSWWRNERGIVLALALVVMTLLMGVGSAALFSGYTNLQTSTNLRLGTRARATAEAAVNEALYRLSRQEGKPGAIAPDLTTADWQMQILSHGTASSPTQVATIQATAAPQAVRPVADFGAMHGDSGISAFSSSYTFH